MTRYAKTSEEKPVSAAQAMLTSGEEDDDGGNAKNANAKSGTARATAARLLPMARRSEKRSLERMTNEAVPTMTATAARNTEKVAVAERADTRLAMSAKTFRKTARRKKCPA